MNEMVTKWDLILNLMKRGKKTIMDLEDTWKSLDGIQRKREGTGGRKGREEEEGRGRKSKEEEIS